jgi:hypothetical protein
VRSPNVADALAFTYWFTMPTALAAGAGYSEPDEV